MKWKITNKKTIVRLAIAAILILNAIVYFPVLKNGFLDTWDDVTYVANNEYIQPLNWNNIVSIFKSRFAGAYCPLTIVSYGIEYPVFGPRPFGYHLTNYLLHLALVFLLFLFIKQLMRDPVLALLTALLWGVHPTHIESVSWIAERKDMLFSFFYMLTLFSFLNYMRRDRMLYYFIALLCTPLAMLSKGMAVTIPLALVVMAVYEGRKDKMAVIDKIPFFLFSLGLGMVSLSFQGNRYMPGSKLYFILKSFPVYIAKLLFPHNMTHSYRYDVTSYPMEAPFYAAVFVFVILFCVVSFRISRKLFFGWCFFVVSSIPVISIVHYGGSSNTCHFAADRFMYLPSMGFAVSLAYGLLRLFEILRKKRLMIMTALLCAGVFASVTYMSAYTWKRCRVWKDTVALFSDVISKEPDLYYPYFKVGIIYLRQRDYRKAIVYLGAAYELEPKYKKTAENLARAYMSLGAERYRMKDFAAARECRDRAEKLWPKFRRRRSNSAALRPGDGARHLLPDPLRHLREAKRPGESSAGRLLEPSGTAN